MTSTITPDPNGVGWYILYIPARSSTWTYGPAKPIHRRIHWSDLLRYSQPLESTS